MHYDRAKRILDIAGAAVLLAITLPLQMMVALVVLVTLGRPVLFRQLRPGLGGEPFQLLKFRTMRTTEVGKELGSEENRLVPVGRKLRAASLDELPTLWNVLRGDMSFVGPRPLLMSYLPLYSSEQARRHEVRPGVTGLAQVSGRNHLSWDQKFALDVEYVDRRSMFLDLSILLKTLPTVVLAKGVNSTDGNVVAPFERSHSAAVGDQGADSTDAGRKE